MQVLSVLVAGGIHRTPICEQKTIMSTLERTMRWAIIASLGKSCYLITSMLTYNLVKTLLNYNSVTTCHCRTASTACDRPVNTTVGTEWKETARSDNLGVILQHFRLWLCTCHVKNACRRVARYGWSQLDWQCEEEMLCKLTFGRQHSLAQRLLSSFCSIGLCSSHATTLRLHPACAYI